MDSSKNNHFEGAAPPPAHNPGPATQYWDKTTPVSQQTPYPSDNSTNQQTPYPTDNFTHQQTPYPTDNFTHQQTPYPTDNPANQQTPYPTGNPTHQQAPYAMENSAYQQTPYPIDNPTQEQKPPSYSATGYTDQFGYQQTQAGAYGPPVGVYQPANVYPPINYQVTAVVQQRPIRPQYPGLGPSHDFLWLSILTCICCCWPLGIPAIVFSSQTRSDNVRGDYLSAKANSHKALGFSLAALICGIIIITWIIIVYS